MLMTGETSDGSSAAIQVDASGRFEVVTSARTTGTVDMDVTGATAAIDVPDDASVMAFYVPALTSTTLSVQGSVGGTNFGTLKEGTDPTGYVWTATTGAFAVAMIVVTGVAKVRFYTTVAPSGAKTIEYGFK